MTREEAVKILKYERDNDIFVATEYREKLHKALDIAIKALEQQPSDGNISDPCDGCRYELNSTNGNPCYSCGKYKLTEQQPSEDTEVIKVSKGAVKARQGRFVIYDVDWLKENFYTTEEKIYGQPKQPCEDAVSREAVVMELEKYLCGVPYEKGIDKVIKELPSVLPQRKMGKWISHREHCENLGVMPSGLGAYEWCSNCDCGIDVIEWHRNPYNYCPNCGAEMEGEDEVSN